MQHALPVRHGGERFNAAREAASSHHVKHKGKNREPVKSRPTHNEEWKAYHNGGLDRSGRTITQIYAVDDDYVIYFAEHPYPEAFWDFWRRWLRKKTERAGWELFYETSQDPVGLGKADAALAGINRLLHDNQIKGSPEHNFNYSTLELAGDALEMIFRDEASDGLEMLKSLREKLQAKEEGQRRLMYQSGTLLIALLPWFAYLVLHGRGYMQPGTWNPWMLGAALAMAGGLFSVCLKIASLEVNVNQGNWFLLFAGATRSGVAFLAGIGLLLAMRSKIFAGISYKGDAPELGESLKIAEMFFCFLAGFSEYFVPNILRDSENKKKEDKPKSPAPSHKDHTPRSEDVAAGSKKKKVVAPTRTTTASARRHSRNAE